MELEKRKYKREEVEELLSSCKIRYESELNEYRSRQTELIEDNKKLSAELCVYKEKDKLISETMISAERKAQDLSVAAERKYELEVEKLKDFSRRWKEYFDYVSEKYPYYEAIKDAESVYEKLNALLSVRKSGAVIKGLEKSIGDKADRLPKKAFDPKSKIDDYIAATGDNGFNLDEVLNPGELKLEDLCKELGLIDEN